MAKTKKTGSKAESKKILDKLPEFFDHMKVVQDAVHLFEEAQKHAADLRVEANKELVKFLGKVGESYQEFGSKVKVVSKEAKKQAQNNFATLVVSWHEKKGSLPQKWTVEVDKLLERVGGMMAAPQSKPAQAKSTPKSKTKTQKSKPAVKTQPVKAQAVKKAPVKKTKAPKKTAKVVMPKAQSTEATKANM